MFKLHTNYQPMGDQPQAIEKLTNNINNGVKYQTLLGATGTGKTFTIANVIKNVNKNTLVLAHNKTLAGQLYSELKNLFPENRVEYFISYYDYYQPEAYVASKDLYIEKDSSINDDIDQMRHSAVSSLLTEENVIVVSSVSCIYGIGDPDDYENNMFVIRKNDCYTRHYFLERLIKMQYERNDYELKRGTFRVKGDIIDIVPTGEKDEAIRLEFFDDEIDNIKIIDTLTGKVIGNKMMVTLYPATLFSVSDEKMKIAIQRIREELKDRIEYFKKENKLLEAQRIEQRTNYDIEMLEEIGICSGIENYSRHLTLREEGETPYTLIDYFKKDFLLVVDESHVTIPQVRGMYNGDRSRKMNLVDYGFRLPSALDNRPLQFNEFEDKLDQVIYVSATPTDFEKNKSYEIVEQIIRPTGLLDPMVEIRKTQGQIDDLVKEIFDRIKKNLIAQRFFMFIKSFFDFGNPRSELEEFFFVIHQAFDALSIMGDIDGLTVIRFIIRGRIFFGFMFRCNRLGGNSFVVVPFFARFEINIFGITGIDFIKNGTYAELARQQFYGKPHFMTKFSVCNLMGDCAGRKALVFEKLSQIIESCRFIQFEGIYAKQCDRCQI